MRLRIDSHTGVPPFEQIRAQLALGVATGQLRPGARLPTIRRLATELDVSTNTVARAYRELIVSGIAEGSGRRGTFITQAPPVAHEVARRSELLSEAADRFALAAAESGSTIDVALEAAIMALRNVGRTVHATTEIQESSDSSSLT